MEKLGSLLRKKAQLFSFPASVGFLKIAGLGLKKALENQSGRVTAEGEGVGKHRIDFHFS